ncbi:hypothetical protein RIF29_08108 [Crotalaria pallida]|uniref:Uncharacterized protein n=1 Tax=Crotalaria pallida TaxID=3830 RepID=A0AAN9J4X4_CROPI
MAGVGMIITLLSGQGLIQGLHLLVVGRIIGHPPVLGRMVGVPMIRGIVLLMTGLILGLDRLMVRRTIGGLHFPERMVRVLMTGGSVQLADHKVPGIIIAVLQGLVHDHIVHADMLLRMTISCGQIL